MTHRFRKFVAGLIPSLGDLDICTSVRMPYVLHLADWAGLYLKFHDSMNVEQALNILLAARQTQHLE